MNCWRKLALQAEVLELRANPSKPAIGAVVEAQLDRGRGAVATVLVQEGTMRKGDIIVAGQHHGRVRAMYDDQGLEVLEAGPSFPVVVLGLSGVPSAGDQVNVADEKVAKEVAERRAQRARVRVGCGCSGESRELYDPWRTDDRRPPVEVGHQG